jgi:hypothetical protein
MSWVTGGASAVDRGTVVAARDAERDAVGDVDAPHPASASAARRAASEAHRSRSRARCTIISYTKRPSRPAFRIGEPVP